ncbi:FG-GAP-like repeat-containing protein [Nannocystis sp. SCPEA4]|uniref:FG-GAP repeat domain-containing protein n=1 Tax=Nannocystis sp. SCPEA4 TaxID=2996787 RepID=UPI00226F1CA8|nr:FG-GAP-like repeat-containing protein [Nannocystis sp. SCPEA4]MCY1056803.1 FG-GAP-like repeat-containing protein [Nannocystis sp. SCPEA4]
MHSSLSLFGDARRVLVAVASLGLAACGDDNTTTDTASLSTSTGPGTTDDTPTGTTTPVTPTGTDSTTQGGSDSMSDTVAPTTDPTDGTATATTGSTTDDTTGPVSASETSTTGETCQGAECCEMGQLFCGAVCCDVGEVCNFTKCEAPGADCKEEADCAGDEYCDYSLGEPDVQPPDPMCMGGVAEPNGKCLKKPPLCGPNDPPQDPNDPECLQSCEYSPAGEFSPTVKFAWGGVVNPPYDSDIMMTPIVVQLDDDDCDGKVTERDIPEIVFSTFSNGAYKTTGSLHAISIVGGVVVDKWNVLANQVNPTKHLAGGDIDGQPGNEIIACGANGQVFALKGEDGSPLWTANQTCFMPAIADLEGDGAAEVIVEGAILDGATGAVKASFNPTLNSSFVISDLDDDGLLDVITSSRGYHADGSVFVDTGLAAVGDFYATSDWKSPWPAVADFDLDGLPEVVVIDNLAHQLSIWRHDPNAPNGFVVVRSPVDINGTLDPNSCPNGSWGRTHGGGPPTVADFDGDGTPDVGTAGGIGYAVFSGAALVDPNVAGIDTFLWIKQTVDCSSASTGSSVFDFDGDGKAEVVYSDQNRLRIYEGPTGNVLLERCNTTATLIEYPVVADVDNDGQADIVVVSNAYGKNDPNITCVEDNVNGQSGVRVFGTAGGKWVRTRRVWNQHTYHITNVNEDGTIPAGEEPNWTVPGFNNFRQNKQPDSEFGAPDAIVAIAPLCEDEDYSLVATVRNIGEAALPAGVVVGFYTGEPGSGTKVGEAMTSKALYPLESETLTLPFNDAPEDVKNGVVNIYAIVDDTMVPHPEWQECRTDNNTGTSTGKCLIAG